MTYEQWIGYTEHQTPDRLNEFHANVGKGGHTIFAEMLWAMQHRNLSGMPWCATFVHAVIARPDLLGRAHPGSRVLARRMRRKGYWRDRGEYLPSRGDLIFCSNTQTKKIDHCGIVLWSDGQKVWTIDGNSWAEDSPFPHEAGGVVAQHVRKLDDLMIVGYGAIHPYLKQP